MDEAKQRPDQNARVAIPLDPETALRALLKVDPGSEPVEPEEDERDQEDSENPSRPEGWSPTGRTDG